MYCYIVGSICKWTLCTLNPCFLHPFLCLQKFAGCWGFWSNYRLNFCILHSRPQTVKRGRCQNQKSIMGALSFWRKGKSQPFSSVFSSHAAHWFNFFFFFMFLLHRQPSSIKGLSCQWWITPLSWIDSICDIMLITKIKKTFLTLI